MIRFLDKATFLTLVRSPEERSRAQLLIESVRSFGGALSQNPIWLFEADPQSAPCSNWPGPDVQVIPLRVPGTVRRYYFADKVYACARAEDMAGSESCTLIWIDPACLVINPPELFRLGSAFDAAVRPVHITNVGIPHGEPLDGFWKAVYAQVGVQDIETTVRAFVDSLTIRAYFNSHAFAVNPSKGLLLRWCECFEALVCDEAFQAGFCRDQAHRIFLHQAILSALLASVIMPERLRLLPPAYNYPYNLHQLVPFDRRAAALNDLTCIAYEDRSLNPAVMNDIDIHEPLRSWLLEHAAQDPHGTSAADG